MSSNSNTTRVGMGNVVITLDGTDYNLVPTLTAALTLSRQTGGIRAAIDSVAKLDLDMVIRVIQLGLDKKTSKELGEDLPNMIWRSGMTDSQGQLAARCIEYLSVLANGGKPMEKTEASDDTAHPPVH